MELWMLCVSTSPSVNTTIGSVNSPAYSSGLNSANAQHQNNDDLVCRNFNRGFQCKFGKKPVDILTDAHNVMGTIP